MDPLYSARTGWVSRQRWVGAASAVVITVWLGSVTAAAAPGTRAGLHAAAVQPLPADSSPGELAALEARAAALSKQYRGQLVTLTEAQSTARAATARALRLRRQAGHAHREVARLAAESYMGGAQDPAVAVLGVGDPRRMLEDAAIVEYLARQRSTAEQALKQSAAAAQRAGQTARARVKELRRLLATLTSKRRAVEALIAKFRPQSPTIGGDRITSRMRRVRDEIDRRFGPFPAIGCYRPGASGEHPLGRACDFMLDSGGAMPSGSWVQRGYDIAAWAQANASRLGIMYIIYRQRIWDIRMASSGWVPMQDRGSITANHFDHVHISVF